MGYRLEGRPAMVGMGEFPYGVMNVRPGGVSSCLCGKVVRLNIARDACMGADFSEVKRPHSQYVCTHQLH